ncbi:MAG: polyphosphate kinase 1 [Bacteroidaceae bacterium]|nr:polyphosphate kinase 1 [Bacteroidaceae bacterium]
MKKEKKASASFRYFDRDMSWLSFNYRVLLEAADEQLPIYERINFIAIFTSNLEEFYKVRVAEHRAVAKGLKEAEGADRNASIAILSEITAETTRQLTERTRIFEQMIVPTLRRNHIVFYQSADEVEEPHRLYLQRYFTDEIFPYLQPMPIRKGEVSTFLRDNRLYMAVRLRRNEAFEYFLLKLPYSKVPRFVELPRLGDDDYIIYMEDIISMYVRQMFPGYEWDSCYCFKISRDADILVDNIATNELLQQLKTKVKHRKNGAISRFLYDGQMPADFLAFLMDAFSITGDELVVGDRHLNLEDLRHLPCPNPVLRQEEERPTTMVHKPLATMRNSVYRYVAHKDLMLFYPYHSFNHFINFLYEAVNDPFCTDIMITQYRVAENSAVINALISAAKNGKHVTVFVELKARFDEENNLETAELMRAAGINIIFSIKGLKVHAKVALVLRKNRKGGLIRSYAYVSTGNFNEKTARQYADIGLFTSSRAVVYDLQNLFACLQKEQESARFKRLLVAKFNLITRLKLLIRNEKRLAREGKGGHIILKMNALQDPVMIDELYKASMAGVQVDLIVRGICCLIPGEEFSRNIRVTRIVDSFLEHSRVWFFANDGNPRLYLGSPDWMRRNLYRRIEVVAPVLDPSLKRQLTDMLHIQLTDNRKACRVDNHLRNVFKSDADENSIRSQYAFYDYLLEKNR